MIELMKRMTKRHVFYTLALVVFITAQVVLELTVPDYMSNITKLVNTKGSSLEEIFACGKMMILFSLLAFVCSIISKYYSSKLAASFSQHLRKEVFEKVESFSLE